MIIWIAGRRNTQGTREARKNEEYGKQESATSKIYSR